MTPLSDKMSSQTPLNVSISFANNLTVMTNRKGRRTVTWNGEKKKTKVGSPETLLSEQVNYSRLSAFTLVYKSIAIVCNIGNEILIDIVDEHSIIGIAPQTNMTSTKLPTSCS